MKHVFYTLIPNNWTRKGRNKSVFEAFLIEKEIVYQV